MIIVGAFAFELNKNENDLTSTCDFSKITYLLKHFRSYFRNEVNLIFFSGSEVIKKRISIDFLFSFPALV